MPYKARHISGDVNGNRSWRSLDRKQLPTSGIRLGVNKVRFNRKTTLSVSPMNVTGCYRIREFSEHPSALALPLMSQ